MITKRLLRVYQALWTFVVVEGVEPTNNHVERAQRRTVLWRRHSFGCPSAAGYRFVERILTVVQTLRLQERSVLQFLVASLFEAPVPPTVPWLAGVYGTYCTCTRLVGLVQELPSPDQVSWKPPVRLAESMEAVGFAASSARSRAPRS